MIAGQQLTRGALVGMGYGAFILTGFGALWSILAFSKLQRLNWRTLLLVTAITSVLCLGAENDFRRAKHAPAEHPSPKQVASIQRLQRQFGVVLAFEWVPIIVVVIVFNRKKRPDLILPAIALIVGLHFLPLAPLFGFKAYYITGIAIVAATVLAFQIRNLDWRQAVVCASCGVVLWVTVLTMVV